MPALLDTIDPDGLLEYSVVFTDRSLNHMSAAFQRVMRDISADLKQVYNADAVAIVPGGGSFAMETVAGNSRRINMRSSSAMAGSHSVGHRFSMQVARRQRTQ